MTSESNIGDAYGVALTHDGMVAVELIVTKAEFPRFTLTMPAAVALRIGEAIVSHAKFSLVELSHGNQPAGGAGAG